VLKGGESGKERNVSRDRIGRSIKEADVARSRNAVDEILRVLEVVAGDVKGSEVSDEDGGGAVREASALEGELGDGDLREAEGKSGTKRVVVEVDALDHGERLETVCERLTTESVSTQIKLPEGAGDDARSEATVGSLEAVEIIVFRKGEGASKVVSRDVNLADVTTVTKDEGGELVVRNVKSAIDSCRGKGSSERVARDVEGVESGRFDPGRNGTRESVISKIKSVIFGLGWEATSELVSTDIKRSDVLGEGGKRSRELVVAKVEGGEARGAEIRRDDREHVRVEEKEAEN